MLWDRYAPQSHCQETTIISGKRFIVCLYFPGPTGLAPRAIQHICRFAFLSLYLLKRNEDRKRPTRTLDTPPGYQHDGLPFGLGFRFWNVLIVLGKHLVK